MKRFFCLALFVYLCAAAAVFAQSPRESTRPVNVQQPGFSFDRAAGPQFTEKEQQAQRMAAKQVVPMVVAAYRQGADSVRIPAGDYRFGKETWGRDGVVYPLEFSGLDRDAKHPFTIDALGATFWFDLGDDQAPKAHFCVGFKDCSHLVLKGATIDRGTRGHLEGRITQLDFVRHRIEIQLSPGVEVPKKFNDNTEQRLLPFKSDGRFCAPLYALQAGGMHLKYRAPIPGTAPGRVWVPMGDAALLDTIRDPNWVEAYGEFGTLGVGDGLSCVYSSTQAVSLVRCRSLTMFRVKIYLAKGGVNETGGDGGHLWKDCYFGPRPGTSQWQGGDGLMCNATRRGTTLEHLTITHCTDDPVNIHGYWSNVQAVSGDRVTFQTNGPTRELLKAEAVAGDRLRFYSKQGGTLLGAAVVKAIAGNTVTLDRDAAAFDDACAEWTDHQCAGWTIENCCWQDDYQRLLFQSGPGAVRHCIFTRLGSGLELSSVMPYVEGGVPREITIVDNVFEDVNPQPHGTAIAAYAHGFAPAGAPWLSDITIAGNTVYRPGGAAIALSNVRGGVISGNRIEQPTCYTALARPNHRACRQAIYLSRCVGIDVQRNAVEGPGSDNEPNGITGSSVLGCDEKCSDIQFEGRAILKRE